MRGEYNYNRDHQAGDFIKSGIETLTMKELRDAIAAYPDDAEFVLSTCAECGGGLYIFGFENAGDNTLMAHVDTAG